MIGTQLGAYRLEEVIGRGGMGVVYRATDTRLGRTVAVKLLPTRTGADGAESPRDPELTRRFLKEAQAASALNHPNIVTLFDVGRQDDVDFIVMEFVTGQTLAERLRGAPVSIPEAASIARQLAGALAAAHAAGIVHRDLKPGNLMLGEDGRLRVLDFGLARMTVSDNADTAAMTLSAALTHPGTLIGTPAYMAPEQIEGAAADARSDIHAFGVILYELLTGVQPFRDSSLTVTAHAIVYREPPPMTQRRPDVPRAFVRLIERCLAKVPAERFADGGELAAALAPVARDIESGAAAAPSLSRRVTEALVDFRAVVRRRRGVRAGLAVAAVAAAALIAWSALPGLRDGVRTRLSSTIPGLAPTPYALYQSGMTDLARYFEAGRIDRAIATFQQAVTEDPSYAPGYVGLAEAHWRRFRENRDPAILTRALGHAREAVRLDPQLVSARVLLGLALIEERDFAGARAALTEARQLDPANARAYRGLGSLELAEGNPAAADSAFTRAIELAPDDWEIRTQRGVLYLVTGEHAKALADFEETARLSPDNHLVHRNVGGAQHMLGRFADAAASFQASLAIKPDPAVYSNLGTIYYFQGLYAQAVAALERSVELGPNNATIWRNLGDSYRQVPDRGDEAAQAYRRAAQLLREELGSVPNDPILTAELALCLAREGNPAGREEARGLITALDSSWRGIPEAAYALVLAFETLGDRAAALDALAAALAASHPVDEVGRDPELVDLRRDPAYHRLLADVDRP